ncbi:MAG: peptidoglycan-binding domain-containing protein [Roseovarius sp.]|nr:peptidoglycan-binding domain-containing protein [Roseovarius sp.]
MTHSKIIIPTVCAALSLSPAPAAANDAIKILGGLAIGAAIGSAVKGQQQQRRQQQVRRAPNPQRQQNRQVQTALNAFGFPVGAVDGALGPKSRAAIRNYQDYMGYPSTGQLTDYERTTLVEGYNRYNAGGGQAYPEVVANEGTKGLLKAFSDPDYVNKYRRQASADTYGVPADQVAGAQGSGTATAGALPALDLTRGNAPVSMATHCEVVAGMSQVNGGVILASDVADPDQALGEQFCEARSYAMTQGQALMTNARATEEQMNTLCSQIADNMAPVVAGVAKESVKVTKARATEIANNIYNGDMTVAAGYGQICLGTGYRQDDAATALGGALSLVAAGEMPYAEIMGHHARWGFGVPQAAEASQVWYETALSAMDNGAKPAFLPSKTVERNAVIRAALSSRSRPAPVEAVAGGTDGGLALPALNLGD